MAVASTNLFHSTEMAFSTPSLPFSPSPSSSKSSSPLLLKTPNSHFILIKTTSPRRRFQPMIAMATSSSKVEDVYVLSSSEKPTKLITFLGKGGSGKTTSSVFAAQHYAMAGLKTCLVTHSQDRTAEYLLNCKIGTSPVTCNDNLSAVRLETTKMLLEPLNRLKQADARLNMTQGVLEGGLFVQNGGSSTKVVGEELGVLPGMDSIFTVLALEKIVGFFGKSTRRKNQNVKYDIVIYDGISTEETLRIIGAASKARLYLKYLRNLAERTDLGRIAGPSALRLLDESLNIGGSGSQLSGTTSGDIWDNLEQTLESGASFLAEPQTFGCYLVMDPNCPTSLNCALRYWGCAIQAGAQVSSAFGIASPSYREESKEIVKNNFSPLPSAVFPHLSSGGALVEWNEILLNVHSKDVRDLLTVPTRNKSGNAYSVTFDSAKKSVTLFMPGFDKSEIKLYQYRGGSELLVEAGDQRRVIRLPSPIQGKVCGAKFIDRSLVITIQ